MLRYTLRRLFARFARRRVFVVIVVARRADPLAPWRAVVTKEIERL